MKSVLSCPEFSLRTRSWLGLALVMVSAVLIAAWYVRPGPDPGHPTPQGTKVIRCDINAPFGSLNPLEDLQSGSGSIFQLLYSRIFDLSDSGELEPGLAVNWSYHQINHTWLIEIRNDVLFHNGHPVTSQDVIYSIRENVKRISHSLAPLIGEFRPLSRYSLEIVLNYDDPEFLFNLVSMLVVPSYFGDSDHPFTEPVGSGPFLYDYRIGDAEVGLVANPSYYGGRPSADRFIFYYQPSEKSWARLLSGETDAARYLQPKDLEILQYYQDRITIISQVLPYYFLLLYNVNDLLFSDPLVRLAMAYAIDKEYMAGKYQTGHGTISIGPFAADSPFHNPALSAIPYDPHNAMELLRKAGWTYNPADQSLWKDGKRFEFSLFLFEGFRNHRKIAEYVSLCLNAIGIRIHLHAVPYDELLKRYVGNNRFQAVLTQFKGVSRNPRTLAKTWHPYFSKMALADSPTDSDLSNMVNLIERAASEGNSATQKGLMYEIEGLFTSFQPATFLFHLTEVDVYSSRIKPVYDSYLYYERPFLFRYYLFTPY
jgi:peptide/nickel transport system substrate-binding protein